ncbi:MAG: ACP S-malonyltransferase [Oscillospiraceae bacterium]|nr:ACP S-malonyltransferase [Oscillospiraceae bacterium]
MNIILFAGQGSQYSGMGKDICEKYPDLYDLYDKASEILGYDLKKVCFDESFTELSRSLYSQPAIMVTSLVCFEAAKKNGLTFSAAAGHSLGEYAAMTATGMLSFEDGIRVIKARAEAFNNAISDSEPGAMAAVLKLDPQKIEEICSQTEGYVVPVNYNSPKQTVIAGDKKAVETASASLSELGARVMTLNVESAFHCKKMAEASREFYNIIKDISFKAPQVKFFSNVYGSELTDFSDIPSLLAKHIISPVKFTDELTAVKAAGFDTFIELGPGKTLTGLVKKTLSDVNSFNIENASTLEKASF